MIEKEYKTPSEVSCQLTAELFFFRQHASFIRQISKTTCERELTANQFYSAGC